jgi:hypothetical protein
VRWRHLGAAIILVSQTPILVALVVGAVVTWPLQRLVEGEAMTSKATILTFDYSTAVVVGSLAGLGWAVFDWEDPLNVALSIMAAFIVVQTAFTTWWGPRDGATGWEKLVPDDKAWVNATQVSITTQGVILGLIAFSEPDGLGVTERTGAASLAAGVLVATLLYLLVVRVPPPEGNRRTVASILLTLQLWTLGFGLICVVAGNWN